MSYGMCTSCLREAELSVSHHCSACQIGQSVKNSSKGGSSDGDLFGWVSEITIPLIVLFAYFEINKWFFLFDNNWFNYIMTFIAAYVPLLILKRTYRSGNEKARYILIFLTIISVYLIVDLFVVALPFVTGGDG